jgi:hypothetical protein
MVWLKLGATLTVLLSLVVGTEGDLVFGDVAAGWTVVPVAEVDQSYAGWDVEIGDADNDGKNEILTTGCPDSRLYLFKQDGGNWAARMLAENLAETHPGMGLTVKVSDLDHNGKNEVLVGTGQEGPGTAFFYLFDTDGKSITRRVVSRPEDCNKSGFTHNFAMYDLDKDGVDEVVSAYCGGGEIIRYDLDPKLEKVDARQLHKLSGSGEESLIADVDNDGAVEYLTANGFRAGQARVEIFEFDDKGELVLPPRIAVDGCDGHGCFYASIMVGDLNNDGKNEMVVGWKREQKINKSSLIAYRVGEQAEPIAVLDSETEDLDMGYFEKMMAIADADNDGKKELVVSTRGDAASENITSNCLGRVYKYTLDGSGKVARELLIDFAPERAESSWLAVGDADNDGKNEVVLATGKGDRTQPGKSNVLMLKKSTGPETRKDYMDRVGKLLKDKSK